MAKVSKLRGYVYFILNPDTGRIKIGFSVAPEQRRLALCTACGVALELLGVVEGGMDIERGLHVKFNAYRVFGEWFEDRPAIRCHIAEHAVAYALPAQPPLPPRPERVLTPEPRHAEPYQPVKPGMTRVKRFWAQRDADGVTTSGEYFEDVTTREAEASELRWSRLWQHLLAPDPPETELEAFNAA